MGPNSLKNLRFVGCALACVVSWGMTPAALAQKESNSAPAAAAPSGGERNATSPKKGTSLETSKRFKFKEKTNIDFEDTAIDGSVKSPFGSIINSRDQDFDKGFIKLRYHWHDQMVMSLSGVSGN
jgi:hypothetical protein